jgi:hypothetical protein
VVRRVAHTHVAADRPAIPHLDVRDRPRHLREDRPRDVDLGGALQLGARDHGADLEHAVRGEPDLAQLVEIGEVDEHLGCSRPLLHHVDQRLASRERASPLVGREHRDRFLDGGRACVFDLA